MGSLSKTLNKQILAGKLVHQILQMMISCFRWCLKAVQKTSCLVIWRKNLPKQFFVVKLTEVRTSFRGTASCSVFSSKLAVTLVSTELCTVFETEILIRTKQLIRKIQLLFLATRSTKESTFDWFKSQPPLLQITEWCQLM